MAWRPTQHLIDGELDNTNPGKVSGWMRFAGLKQPISFDLDGNFHRDIRGAKIRLRGPGDEADPDTADYLESFATRQVGKVGDITAGRAPRDYVDYPYIEWYSEANGRVVIELQPEQVTVIGAPIPFIESDALSRDDQRRNMAEFLNGLTLEPVADSPAAGDDLPRSDPAFSHWVLCDGRIVGEARDVDAGGDSMRFAFIRLFGMPDMAESGYVPASQLRKKSDRADA